MTGITECSIVYWRGTTMSREALAILELMDHERRDEVLEQFSHIEFILHTQDEEEDETDEG